MRAKEMYKLLYHKSLKTIKLRISLSTPFFFFRKLLNLILVERYTIHFLCFSTRNENSKLLSMIWNTSRFSFENSRNIYDCFFFIPIHSMLYNFQLIWRDAKCENMRCEYFPLFSFAINSFILSPVNSGRVELLVLMTRVSEFFKQTMW